MTTLGIYGQEFIKKKTSLQIAEEFNKQHKHVLESIRNFINRNKDEKIHFYKTTYTDKKGEKRPMYYLDDYAEEVLRNKFKYNIRSARFEYKFANILKDMFPNEIIYSQVKLLNEKYRVDFILEFANIFIEYDEKEHKYKKEYDEKRENEIIKELNRKTISGEDIFSNKIIKEPQLHLEGKEIWKCIRVKEGEEIDGLRRLCIEITESTLSSCSDFMD